MNGIKSKGQCFYPSAVSGKRTIKNMVKTCKKIKKNIVLLLMTRNLEGRSMRIEQIYACVLLYFSLKVAAFDVPS